MRYRIDFRMAVMLIISLSAIVAVMLLPAIPQDPGYHVFADGRSYLGIPNVMNVGSNLVFIAVGLAGLWAMRNKHARITPAISTMFAAFFAGILLTGLGSSWYHLNPDNERLMWDRLPMTIAFMAFFSIIINERLPKYYKSGLMFPVFLIAGVLSVIYWYYTETQGQGDLRFYVLVQFLPAVLIPLMLLLYRSRYPGDRLYWLVLGFYIVSKVVEHWDHAIFQFTANWVSGHTLKHIAAASAAYVMYRIWCQPTQES